MNDDTLEYLQGFVVEGKEMLDDAEQFFIELEKLTDSDSTDHEIVHQLFRTFHTFKGVASFLNLDVITKVTHEAENFLDQLRNNKAKLKRDTIDLLVSLGDFLREALEVIDVEHSDKSLQEHSRYYIDEFTKLNSPDAGEANENNSEESGETEEVQDQVDDLKHDPELLKQFVIEGEEILNQIEQDLLSFEQESENFEFFNSVFRNFHSFKGNCGFFGFTDLEKICHKCENIFDFLRDNPRGFNKAINSNFLSIVTMIRSTISHINKNGDANVRGVKPLLSILDDLREIIDVTELQNESLSEFYYQIVETMVSMVDDDFKEFDQKIVDSSDLKNSAGAGKPGINTKRKNTIQTIRVDTSKLDILLNLVGELVISQSMISSSPDIVALNAPLPIFEKRLNDLKKICREVQEASMAMRMLPIDPLFKKMIRLVRDVAIKSKKEVKLELRGGETEVDKNLIENLGDPLVHILRNAVDHGIESVEERISAGKNKEGTIVLEALHANGEVWIRIKDDGKGLNKDKILKKAIDKGLASAEETYKDEEIFNFIFLPGFSTAEQVSNISGRGVGMDVVRTQLEALKGRIRISSEPGVGTTFTLSIPLTMAILDGMIVDVDSRFYAIPISAVQETFQYEINSILRLSDGTEMIRVRENHHKVLRLSRYYNTSENKKDHGILMMLSHDQDSVCVFVDEIIGQQQIVLKPLPNYIGHIKSISGCAILSGGQLSMVLDTRELIMDTM